MPISSKTDLSRLRINCGAMNTVNAAVADRTRPVGTLRALGFSRFRIVTAFLAESIALAVVGGIIRCATNFLSISDIAFTFRITPVLMAGGLLFTAMIGAVGGLLPAIGPARIPVAYPLREI